MSVIHEPEDHKLAASWVESWFIRRFPEKVIVKKNSPFYFPQEFIKLKGCKWNVHSYDVVVWSILTLPKIVAFIELDQLFETYVTLPTGRSLKVTLSKHGKPNQILKDQIAEEFVSMYYPKCTMLRLQKSDVFISGYLDKVLSVIDI